MRRVLGSRRLLQTHYMLHRNQGHSGNVIDENKSAAMPCAHQYFCLLISEALVRVQHPEPFEKPLHVRAFRFHRFRAERLR
jgi:hypothetical protein